MSDKELLEKAAKAAGYDLAWGGPDGDMARRRDTWDNWNPLFNDGDALRLAVKLRMCVDVLAGRVIVTAKNRESIVEPHYGEGPDRATRRAIVRAAAALAGDREAS